MKKRLFALFLVLVLAIGLVPGAALAAETRDTSYEESVAAKLKELGLFQGVSDTDFALNRAPTRVEAIVMLIRVLGKEDEALNGTYSHPFTDVPRWANKYIGYAYGTGLTNGVSNTEFGTGAASAQMYVTFMLRALGYSDENNLDFNWKNPFDLASSIGILPEKADLNTFLRADVVLISYSALPALIKGTSTTLAQRLISAGVFTQAKYDEIVLGKSASDASENETVFEFLVNYCRKNGELTDNGTYSTQYSSYRDKDNIYDAVYFAEYYPKENIIKLKSLETTPSGDHFDCYLTVTASEKLGYSVSFDRYWDDSPVNYYGKADIDPNSFYLNSTITLTDYLGSEASEGSYASHTHDVVWLIISRLYLDVLSDAGYSYEDLGFIHLSDEIERAPVFDFLVDYCSKNDNKVILKYLENDTYNSLYAISYDPEDNDFSLSCLDSHSNGSTDFYTLTLTASNDGEYNVGYVYSSDSTTYIGLGSVRASTFTSESTFSFRFYTGADKYKSDDADNTNISVWLALAYLNSGILSANGYTLADLGFTSFNY